MTPKTIAIIGAGNRGNMFAMLVEKFSTLGKVVAVADPREPYRKGLAETYGVKPDMMFVDWQDFAARPKLCDAVVIATMDREHAGPAVACLKKGYDVLLEKPMAITLADCQAIEKAQRESGRIVAVCHSLRFHKGFRKAKELIDGGAIGKVMHITLLEQVAFWHQAHSFVRGNWGNEGRATFMLLAKSCHDIDYLCYLIGKPCLRVSSFGSLGYFRRENAPAGSADRCTAPCPLEPTCPYSAVKTYAGEELTGWVAGVVSPVHTREAHLEALKTSPYGRCVWKCDNDVVDHQVVGLEFEEGVTVSFTMTGLTQGMGRRLSAHGTEGELAFDEGDITVRTFADGNIQRLTLGQEVGGHGGGDVRVVREWLMALLSRDTSGIVADAQESLASHTVVFAAERARREKRVVELSELQPSRGGA